MKKYFIYLIAILILAPILSMGQGYKIKIKVKGVSDTTAYLGNYYADKKYAIDTIRLDKTGSGTFEGTEPLKGGIYMVLFPSMNLNYFELLVDNNEQNFSLETDTLDFTKYMKVKGSPQNTAFFEFHQHMSQLNQVNIPIQKRMQALPTGSDSLEIYKDLLSKSETELKAYWADLVKQWDGKLFGAIINAMIDVEIPEMTVPENIANKDSAQQMMKYIYHKDHYFDHINLKDDRMIRTPFLASRIDQFMTKVVVQHPDSVIKEGVKLIETARGTEENFSYLVRYMFGYKDKSKLMGMDKVFVEISERYYLTGQATWADSAFIEKVRDRVAKEKPNLIGNTAPRLDKLETLEKQFVSLSDLKNKYIIVAFWEPNCGHCKKTIPALYHTYKDLKQNGFDVQTLSICTQPEREPWEKFIEEKELFDWINAYDKYNFNNFRLNYDIYSTPTLYLLDKDKKIIGKRLAVEQIEQIIYSLEGKKAPTRPKSETDSH
jgi:thiol-disulfide isomerase/thioredoxin